MVPQYDPDAPASTPAAPPLPMLLYDGRCAFCRRWVARWQGLTGDRVSYVPYQTGAGERFSLSVETLSQASHFVTRGGDVHTGARAILGVLQAAGRCLWITFWYDRSPAFGRISESAYRVVSSNRGMFNALDLTLFGRNTRPVTHIAVRRMFLILLGMIYLCAFASLAVQIRGLVGGRGILPIAPQLHGLASGDGGTPILELPTLFWINASDAALVGVCVTGMILGALMSLRVAPILTAAGAWLCYLSLATAGQTFLSFQWDSLLLEAGFLAILLSPPGLWRSAAPAPPSRIVIWLYRWLLFRVMFLSGLVKIFSGDPCWAQGTALDYHYWTQPLPTPIAWYANLLPAGWQHMSTVGALLIELGAPIFYFAPRQIRRLAFAVTVGFQCLILLTGNFGFFNLLTLLLCLMLLDDTFWPLRRWKAAPLTLELPQAFQTSPRRNLATELQSAPGGNLSIPSPRQEHAQDDPAPVDAAAVWRFLRRQFSSGLPLWVTLPLAALLLFLTTVESTRQVDPGRVPAWADSPAEMFRPFRSANGYGLFAVMTRERPEVIIEGSDDLQTWRAFNFRYKPMSLERPPPFCTPYMPRLDWQMWFAGLQMQSQELPSWLVKFMRRLLEGSPAVRNLLAPSPFADHPPRYVRATVSYYRFTTWPQRQQTHAWWRREDSGLTTGPIMLGKAGQLVRP